MSESPSPLCPYCQASLLPNALVCPKCNRWLEKITSLSPSTSAERNKPAVNATLLHNQQTLRILIPIMFGIGLLCILVGGLGGYWLYSQQKKTSSANQAAQTEIAGVRTATAQVVSTWRAIYTQQAVKTQAAVSAQAEADLASLRKQASEWEEMINESFETDTELWYTGEQEDELVRGAWSISNGQYEIDLEAVDNFAQWMWPDNPGDVIDFYLATRLAFLKGPETMDGGLIFRLQGEDQFYLFDLYSNGDYAVYIHTSDGWEVIIEETPSEYYLPEAANELEVISIGERFVLFLNGILLTEFSDDRLPHGWVGMLVGLAEAGDQGRWAFDDFILHAPPNQK